MITVTRYHDFCAGHRVVGHEGKCAHLHGHNYRVHFTCEGTERDSVGRVIDFAAIKEKLCMWLEDNWDHKFLAWGEDAVVRDIYSTLPGRVHKNAVQTFQGSIVNVPFNPTAENMAEFLVEQIGPQQLQGTGVVLTEVTIDETRKCSATYRKKNNV